MMANACNPSYSRGIDQKDCGSRPAQVKKLRSQSQPTDMLVYICNPIYSEDVSRKIRDQGQSQAKSTRPYLKITETKRAQVPGAGGSCL
jgi:hypothetical protein